MIINFYPICGNASGGTSITSRIVEALGVNTCVPGPRHRPEWSKRDYERGECLAFDKLLRRVAPWGQRSFPETLEGALAAVIGYVAADRLKDWPNVAVKGGRLPEIVQDWKIRGSMVIRPIVVQRDLDAVLASCKKWGETASEDAIRRLQDATRACARRLDAFAFRYEDLLSDPETTIRALGHWLWLEPSEDAIRSAIALVEPRQSGNDNAHLAPST